MITAVIPNRGSEGTDVIIEGNGFNNATGVQFGGVSAAWLKESDARIRATVPPGAVAGKITVLDPDGNQLSPEDFDLVQSVLPQNTTRGRNALDVITLVMAAMQRLDYDGVTRFLSPQVIVCNAGALSTITKPTAQSTAADIAAYNAVLDSVIPKEGFALQQMQLLNDAVSLWFGATLNENEESEQFNFVFRLTSAGYRIGQIVKNDI
jgi:hypothetical protein